MTLGDIDAVADWFASIDDVSFFDRSAVLPISLEAMRESWKADLDPASIPPKALWYICEEKSGRPAAIGGLRMINYINGDAVLPAFVARNLRGQGVGIRLVAMLLDAAFTRLRLVRVTTFYREDNVISARLTRRAGFCEEGRMRKALLANGCHHDMVVLGLLSEEWAARREELQAELDGDTVLGFPGAGNEQYDWPRRPRADNLVSDLAARRERLEAAGRKGVLGFPDDQHPTAAELLNRF
jgi:RimJ/RimL family protein N-acetyltransferase